MTKNPFREGEDKERVAKEYRLQTHILAMHQRYFPHVLLTHVPNQARNATEAFFNKKLGVQAGVTDFILWWHHPYPNWALEFLHKMFTILGYCFPQTHVGVVELKVDAYPTEAQKKFMERIEIMGGKAGVTRSWEQYYKLLCSWRIKPKEICVSFTEPDYRSKREKFADAFDFYAPT